MFVMCVLSLPAGFIFVVAKTQGVWCCRGSCKFDITFISFGKLVFVTCSSYQPLQKATAQHVTVLYIPCLMLCVDHQMIVYLFDCSESL